MPGVPAEKALLWLQRPHHQGNYRENLAHVRQSRPDSGLGCQVKGLTPFDAVASWTAAPHSALERAVQGYLAHKKPTPPYVPTVDLCLGPYGDVGVSSARGPPVFWPTPAQVTPFRTKKTHSSSEKGAPNKIKDLLRSGDPLRVCPGLRV